MMKMKNFKAIFRRGQTQVGTKQNDQLVHQTLSTQTEQEEIQKNWSTSSLGSSKSKKHSSKEKIDKAHERKHDKHQSHDDIMIVDDPAPSSFNQIEKLRVQLKEISNEKSKLEMELAESKSQLQLMKNEIGKLKVYIEQSNMHIQQLNEENTALRNRLKDIAHSPLSDNEKQLLLESHRHSSAPASIATNVIDENAAGESSNCTTGTSEWDKYSSSNVSEVSVACLQDKINQMQETHYSTNEELQATLQELTDLQRQLTEVQQDNERLLDEKNLMFDSLCRQTERLNDARAEVESLKQLLYRDKEDSTIQLENIIDREQKLVNILKQGQEEREALLLKLEQLNSEVQELRSLNDTQSKTIELLTERLQTLESSLDAKMAEYRQLHRELATAKDQCNVRQIEIDRLTVLLDNAKTKISEIEQERALNDKSELDELLDNVRKEKDALEGEVAHLKEQVAYCNNESEKLREQLSILQEEFKVTRNNAKCTQAELEYKCEKITNEKINIAEQLQQLQEAFNELQIQTQCQQEDKRQLSAVLSETQRNLSETEKQNVELGNELDQLKRIRKGENEEWEKFQNDLLTSVRVANDFKSEAQQELQKMILENKAHREKIRQLENQIEKLKVTNETLRPTSFSGDDLTLKQKGILNRQGSRQSVKSLIESIENAAKSTGLSKTSRTSSNSSLNLDTETSTANSSEICSALTTPATTPSSPLKVGNEWIVSGLEQKSSFKEQSRDWPKNHLQFCKADLSKVNINGKTEESLRETILQTAKDFDFSRRNSYSDLCDRKDPLNGLVKNGGSKRNALLKWCQNKTLGYRNIDITNFSSSWNDGLAFCAILHTYLPEKVPYDSLVPNEKRRNFSIAFSAAESVGIPTTLNINDMIQMERPDWQQVMSYVTAIYKHFET